MNATAPRSAGPRGYLLSGHLPLIAKDPLTHLPRWHRQYGDIVRLRFGRTPVFSLGHPDLAEEVLVTQSRRFIKSMGVRVMKSLLGEGLLTSEGEFWRRQRRLAQPAFHHQRILAYGKTMVDLTGEMLDSWREGEVRDIHHEMMRLTLAIAARTLFSAHVTDDADEVAVAVRVALEHFNRRLGSFWRLLIPERFPLPDHLRYFRAVRGLDRLVYRIIEERRASGEDRGDLLSMLLAARDEDGSAMTDRQLRDEVMTLILAGHETTAVLLSWSFSLLARHPEAEGRLAAEVASVLGDRLPSASDLSALRYTQMALREALRLYPPAWLLGREPLEDLFIGGQRMPRGSVALISPWVLHRDPRFYEEPEAFRPERWEGDLAGRLPRMAFLPFGGGPRICIGNQFALMEATLILAAVLRRFRLTPVAEAMPEPEPLITVRPKGGVLMRLSAR